MDTNGALIALEGKLRSTTNPWERLPLLIELSAELGHYDHGRAMKYALEAFTLSKQLNDQFWIARSFLALGKCKIRQARYTELLYYFEQSSRMFERLKDARMKALADFHIAKTYLSLRESDKALSLLLQALQVFRHAAMRELTVEALGRLADLYGDTGDYEKAIEIFDEAILLAEEPGLEAELGRLYQLLAYMYRRMEDGENQIKYLMKAHTLLEELGDVAGIAISTGNIATFYLDRREIALAEPYILRSKDLYHQLGFVAQEALACAKMSEIYEMRKDFAGSFRCFRIALTLCRETENRMALGKVYESIGVTCHKTGRPHHCLAYFLKALAILEEFGDNFYLYQIHRLLGNAFENVGDATKALFHFREYERIRAEVADQEKWRKAGQAELRSQLKSLTMKVKEEQSVADRLKEEIEEKKEQLVSLALQLVRSEETKKKEKRVYAYDSSRGGIASDDSIAQSWDMFARQFHKVHHGFYTDLIRRFPGLTPTEVKVCSLIRIGLSTKEIAGILCIAKRTVDNHRARIHTKMRLPQASSLSGFIVRM